MDIEPSEIHVNLFWISEYYNNIVAFKRLDIERYYHNALKDIEFYLKIRQIKLSPEKILDDIFMRLMN